MKSTGIVRRIDELGRFVLPIEIRENLDIGPKDSLEIYVEGSRIILKKFQFIWMFLLHCRKFDIIIFEMCKAPQPILINRLRSPSFIRLIRSRRPQPPGCLD